MKESFWVYGFIFLITGQRRLGKEGLCNYREAVGCVVSALRLYESGAGIWGLGF